MALDLIKGIIVGICASIPLGPVGILCIQKTLSKGKVSGLITGLGTAVADNLFASIALLSLSFVDGLLTTYRDWVFIGGGVFVVIYGITLVRKNPIKQVRRPKEFKSSHFLPDFASSFFMTISNPGALLLLIGIFAVMGVDLNATKTGIVVALILLGVFIGSSIWWFTLTSIINHFRNKFRLRQLLLVNRIAGIVIVVLGLISMFEGLSRIVLEYIN